ncbi:MAG: TIR domain-containing protein [Actinobacteria bacterium]|nr:TIR domain-containing protein [Actinomycetota bacterium]
MPDKVIFIAFAKEDEAARNLFSGQRINARSPYSFVDMSVKEPYSSQWKERVRTRVRRSAGVIALISSNTPAATGQLWEIGCARDEGRPLLGLWIEDGYRTKPAALGTAPVKAWTWEAVSVFIDAL